MTYFIHNLYNKIWKYYKQLGIKYPFRSSIAIISIHIVMTVLEKNISVLIDQKENAN